MRYFFAKKVVLGFKKANVTLHTYLITIYKYNINMYIIIHNI